MQWLAVIGDGATTTAAATESDAKTDSNNSPDTAVHSRFITDPWISADKGACYYPLTFHRVNAVAAAEQQRQQSRSETVDTVTAVFVTAEDVTAAPVSQLLETYYAGRWESSAYASLKSRCSGRISAVLSKLRERADGFQQQLANSGETHMSRACICMTYGHVHARIDCVCGPVLHCVV